jgi:hypothetical protein
VPAHQGEEDYEFGSVAIIVPYEEHRRLCMIITIYKLLVVGCS